VVLVQQESEIEMSRPKFYWYDITKKMIMRYPNLDGDIPLEAQFLKAIESTMEEVEEKVDSVERKKAFNMLLFKKTHTTSGAALKLHYSERTIQYWVNDFVNEVGRKAGFCNESEK